MPTFDPKPVATAYRHGTHLHTKGMTANHRKELRTLWRRFVALVPRKYVQEITAVHLLAPNSGAGIVPNVTETWDLQLSSVSSGNVDHILVHELAHLMTVRKSETTAEPDSTVCPTIPMGYGCARPGSLYDRYTKKFWPKELREETRLPGKRQSYAETFARHPGYFVTPYAAMNPSEDFAETFRHFVFDDKPTGDTIADQKVLWCWHQAALLTLRKNARVVLTKQ